MSLPKKIKCIKITINVQDYLFLITSRCFYIQICVFTSGTKTGQRIRRRSFILQVIRSTCLNGNIIGFWQLQQVVIFPPWGGATSMYLCESTGTKYNMRLWEAGSSSEINYTKKSRQIWPRRTSFSWKQHRKNRRRLVFVATFILCRDRNEEKANNLQFIVLSGGLYNVSSVSPC